MQSSCSETTRRIAPEDVHACLRDHFQRRADIGFCKAVLEWILEPQNPFESEKRRQPKHWFLFGAGLFVSAVGWFVYFNLTH
jgi:hypothetical protein